MILVVSSSPREATHLAALCEQQSWPCEACTTVNEFGNVLEKNKARAVVVRLRLRDGYSDDVLATLRHPDRLVPTRVVVLVPADCTIQQEARQVKLGADCVLRDPIRMEVLLEYLARYRAENDAKPDKAMPLSFEFAGAEVSPHEHRLTVGKRSLHVAPQEIGLMRLLSRSAGEVVPYPVLYTELFNQRFAGDTANCRVLLGKIAGSFRKLGIDLRRHIEVIPKSGYLYSPPARSSARLPSGPATRAGRKPGEGDRRRKSSTDFLLTE